MGKSWEGDKLQGVSSLVEGLDKDSEFVALPSKPFKVDLTICVDVSPNPGPETSKRINFGAENLITVGASSRSAAITKITYKPSFIRSLRFSQLAKYIDEHTYSFLRYFEILKPYRGLRSGTKVKQRKVANNINNNVINIHPVYARRICISKPATDLRSHIPSNCVSIVSHNSTEQQTPCIKIATPETTSVSDSADTDSRNIDASTSTVSHISTRRHSNPGSNLKIVHVNIRSLRNTDHLIQVREFAKSENIDVLTISETWLNSTVTNKEITIDGYKLHRLDRLHKKGGGVCLYIRNDIKENILKDISDCNFHQLWLQLQYKKLKSLVLYYSFINEQTYNILGDLNCITLKECPENKALTDISIELNLTQSITTPTRITDRSQSLIDVILIFNPDLVCDSGVIDTAISDHLPVFATLKLRLPKPPSRFITVRSFKNYDPSLFSAALASNSSNLLSIFTKPDVDSKLATFNIVLISTLEAHAPVKRIKIRSRPCPYVTTEIKDLMNARDRILRRFKTTRDDNDWHIYMEARQTIKTTLRNAERNYIRNEVQTHKDKPGCLWKIINKVIPSKERPTLTYAWKKAEVIPLLKDGDHEQASNNRPLSLLPVASKVCEKIVLSQFNTYLTRNNRLSSHQSGNKKHFSTETLSIFVNDTILKAMDNKKLTALVLLDLSKAFDSVNHNILLQKLERIGASKPSLRWFGSYLNGRSQVVRIGSTSSSPLNLTHGVPQGAILSPLLFCIYMNDLPLSPRSSSLESYVDDSKVFLSFPIKDTTSTKANLEEDLCLVAKWCSTNHLLINPEKTKFLLIGTPQLLKKLPSSMTLSFLGKDIIPVFSAKDLGVTLDSHLSYNEHIKNLVSSCTAKLCQINRVKDSFDKETLKLIISSLVISKLFYCSSTWSNTSSTNISKLQAVQNFACRIITNTRKFDHITPALRQISWLPVKEQLILRDSIMKYKCMNSLVPQYLSEKFSKRSSIHSRLTRNQDTLQIPFNRTATGQRSFHYRAVNLWNGLDENIKEARSLRHFKKLMKNNLLDHYFNN
ncbi:Hypothetical predicted protein [Paramuricea clavata]|uniref:Uncharacterized protein n=1 Tax=Paramuricea clavata TaxID=317549 RepID=A0A7D9DCY7_PARCT|nr:Hypothetical predicted protein [Paramuricea clavata]